MLSLNDKLTIDNLFIYISEKISNMTSVQLGANQHTLVNSRLSKKIRDLGDLTVYEYLKFLSGNESSEMVSLGSLLKNHNSFFSRELTHFEYLSKYNLKEIVIQSKKQGRKKITIWSPACSRGQEGYSLSMFLHHHLNLVDPKMDFEIFGPDISPKCIDISLNGVYKLSEIKSIPSIYLDKHWPRGIGDITSYVKTKKSIKKKTNFDILNLLEFQNFLEKMKFDTLFCRNVFRYFEQEQINSMTRSLLNFLQPYGQLFLRISESLVRSPLAISYSGNSIYAKKEYVEQKKMDTILERNITTICPNIQGIDEEKSQSIPVSKKSNPIKVMCVDDSPTVLKILEKIIKKNPKFEYVGSAKNGIDAAEKIKTLKPDVMTLDIHMPEQNGLEYLIHNHKQEHPPVIIVSSVAREDANIAIKCFEKGAFDYIEKPSLQTIKLLEGEICTKISSVYEMKDVKRTIIEVDETFKRRSIIQDPQNKLRVVYAHVGQIKRLFSVLNQFRAPQPPTVVFFEGAENLLESIKNEFEKQTVKAELIDEGQLTKLATNSVYFADVIQFHDKLCSVCSSESTSVLITGKPSKKMIDRAVKWKNAHIIIEDIGSLTNVDVTDVSVADQTVPLISFAYESDKYLSQRKEKSVA